MKHILVITTWSYTDGLIQSAVIPYLEIMKRIDPELHFFLVTSENGRTPVSDYDYIELIPSTQHNFGIKKLLQVPLSLLKLRNIISRKKVQAIHCFCTPAGVTGYILSKLTGTPLLIDSYEPHAQSMVENGTWKADSLAFKILWKLEKLQSKRAVALISCTAGMLGYAKENYGIEPKNFFIKPACVDLKAFYPDENLRNMYREKLGFRGKIVCIYVGKFGGIYLEQEVYDFFKKAADYWKDRFRVVLLTGSPRAEIEQLAVAADIDPSIITSFKANHDEVNHYLNAADFAITPVKPVPSKKYCSPIKNGEYWAVGLPVIITKDISDDSQLIVDNNIGAVLDSLQKLDYHNAITKIESLLHASEQQELSRTIRAVAEQYRGFYIAEQVYQNIYGTNGILKSQ